MKRIVKVFVYSDGGSKGNPGPSAIGIIVCDENGEILHEHKEFVGRMTNNQAEYTALIKGLEMAAKHCREEVNCISDSQLIVKQMNKGFRIKDVKMRELFFEVKKREDMFTKVNYIQVTRKHDMISRANSLVSKVLDEY